jgi:hypothetical protein
VTATLEDMVTTRDHVELLDWVRRWIQRAGPVRVLISLHAFAGWKPDVSLQDARLWLGDDEDVLQMAIVGPLEWKQRVLTVLTQPLRRLPISYFESEAEARRWLRPDTQTPAAAAAV